VPVQRFHDRDPRQHFRPVALSEQVCAALRELHKRAALMQLQPAARDIASSRPALYSAGVPLAGAIFSPR
jgi:hypothetical protein